MARVALVKGNDRRENLRKALEQIAEDINLQGRRPVIKVNLTDAKILHVINSLGGLLKGL